MSIARAVLEFSADKRRLGAKTLFATHYHELTELENSVAGVKNYNIAVKKRGDDITFLRRIVKGCADGSYGIEVAKLAGIPNEVIKRAKEVLASVEKTAKALSTSEKVEEEKDDSLITFDDFVEDQVIEELKAIDINTLSPYEAMSFLYNLKKRLQ
jgi:DNA mismatch repair protein MutS